MTDLQKMHLAFKNWCKKADKTFCVYWIFKCSPYLTMKNFYWLIEILPCIGQVKYNKTSVFVTSVMGTEYCFLKKQCKIFSNRKEAVRFRDEKRKELYQEKNLFS
jgi:hypothetical protein